MKTVAWLRSLVLAVFVCATSASAHAQAVGGRALQSKQILELQETLIRVGTANQRLLNISAGMHSVAQTQEQQNKVELVSIAYEGLIGADCLLQQMAGMLTVYDFMSHEPDRLRVTPMLTRQRGVILKGVPRTLDNIETKWLSKLAGSPAGDSVKESLRELSKAVEILGAIKL
jgi:hypothetical protein